MRQLTVGTSGLSVSSWGLGTLTWGRDTSPDEAGALLSLFHAQGGTLLETSPLYGRGSALRTLGRLFTHSDGLEREDFTLALRLAPTAGSQRRNIFSFSHSQNMVSFPNEGMLFGRHDIMAQLHASLRELGIENVDVLLVPVPALGLLDEVAETLEILISQGKVNYVGFACDYTPFDDSTHKEYTSDFFASASSLPSWPLAASLQYLNDHHFSSLVCLEAEYSLLNRHIEKDISPIAKHFGLGILAASPLARGVLTGKYREVIRPESRAASTHLGSFVEPYLRESYRKAVNALATAASGLSASPMHVALQWLEERPVIASALLGVRTLSQLEALFEENNKNGLPQEIADTLSDITEWAREENNRMNEE